MMWVVDVSAIVCAVVVFLLMHGRYHWRMRRAGWTKAKIRNGRPYFDPPVRLLPDEHLVLDRKYRRGRLVAAYYRKVPRWQ